MRNNSNNENLTLRPAPKVAVIIPYYNGADWVERAIISVLSQTVKADEFVIVNDGSTPDQRQALALLKDKYPFNIIDKENGGQGSARNTGVAATTSEYISLLDQDDFYLPNHIKDLVGALPEDDPRLGYVYADLCEADGAGSIIHSNMLRQQSGQHPKAGHITTLLQNDMFVLPSASLINRTAFISVGGFDEQFMGYEDDDLFLRMFRAGFTNYFLNQPVTVWCMHTGSTSWSIKMSRSRFRYLKKLSSLYLNDDAKGMYYFRDCLMRRFGRSILLDSLKAGKSGSIHRAELSKILNEYVAMAYVRPEISISQKWRLKITAFILTRFSKSALKLLSACIHLAPKTRNLVGRALLG